MQSIHAYQYQDDDLPIHPRCALNTDLCVCGVEDTGNPCGICDHPFALYALPERLQPKEPYLIENLCYNCGDQFTTDTRDGR